MDMPPLLILLLGTVIVIYGIVGLRVGAFISLIVAAVVVSLLSPGDDKIARVAAAFGSTAGGIGIVIALAAVIGRCLMDSGAADRIVRAFLHAMGEKRAATAMMGSGFVLAVPVFFDTVFYLLVPLARSMYRRLGRNYLKFILAISAGGAITHTLVPPTPGPLLMADNLGISLGTMIMVGGLVAIPGAIAGLIYAGWADKRMPIVPEDGGAEDEGALEHLEDEKLPSLAVSILPVLLPVLLISTNTVLTTIADGEHAALLKSSGEVADWEAFRGNFQGDISAPSERLLESEALGANAKAVLLNEGLITAEDKAVAVSGINEVLGTRDFYDEEAFLGVRLSDASKGFVRKDQARSRRVKIERMNRLLLEDLYPESQFARHVWDTPARQRAGMSDFFGNANFALLVSAAIAMLLYVKQRRPSRHEFGQSIESSLMSGGLIILITAAGGAFGAMLKAAQIGPAIQAMWPSESGAGGVTLLLLGFFIASLLKIAQGSSTVAMITASSMLAAMINPDTLGFHPVYLATAIGGGSLVGSWMNDSGFWIFTKMGGLSEVQSLRSWTPMLAVLGIVAFVTTVILSFVLPMNG